MQDDVEHAHALYRYGSASRADRFGMQIADVKPRGPRPSPHLLTTFGATSRAQIPGRSRTRCKKTSSTLTSRIDPIIRR